MGGGALDHQCPEGRDVEMTRLFYVFGTLWIIVMVLMFVGTMLAGAPRTS